MFKHKKEGFTLAEILIALVIIGVVATISIPSVLSSSQDKEFHSKLKKNISVIENALRRAQIDEGMLGDNTAIFTPSESTDRHYESAQKLSKYVNTMILCKNQWSEGCSELYYTQKYNVSEYASGEGDLHPDRPKLMLADGSVYTIWQEPNCQQLEATCEKDEHGNCKKDEDGNDVPSSWSRKNCAGITVDVNGQKGPNKYGKDTFSVLIMPNKIAFDTGWSPTGGKIGVDILLNKK